MSIGQVITNGNHDRIIADKNNHIEEENFTTFINEILRLKLSDNERDFVKLKLSRKIISILKDYFKELKENNKIKGEPEIMAVTLINSLLGAFTIEILGDYTVSNIKWEELVEEHTKQFVSLYKI